MVVSNVRLGLSFPGGICAARNALSTNGLTMRISSVRAGGVGISIGTSPLDQRSASTVTPAGARHATLPMAEASDALRTPFNSARSAKARASASAPGTCLAPCPPDTSNSPMRSEEHTSELQSLMRISYAVFCLKKNTTNITHTCHKTTVDHLN